MLSSTLSAFCSVVLRVAISSLRIDEMYSSHPVASTLHAEKNLSKSESSLQARQSAPHRASVMMQDFISVLQLLRVLVFAAWLRRVAIWAVMPAARHDCSIKLSYVSVTSSEVQLETFLMHSVVAQAYLAPGSDGAFLSSFSDKVMAADVPTDTLRMPFDAGIPPANAVPQYWHRAAGFDDTFMAHAESKQRVKFAREHVTASAIPGARPQVSKKSKMCLLISLYIIKNYIKKAGGVQREKEPPDVGAG